MECAAMSMGTFTSHAMEKERSSNFHPAAKFCARSMFWEKVRAIFASAGLMAKPFTSPKSNTSGWFNFALTGPDLPGSAGASNTDLHRASRRRNVALRPELAELMKYPAQPIEVARFLDIRVGSQPISLQ